MVKTPFVIVPALAAIAVAYRQPRLIADNVLPRVGVMTQSFRYLKYGLGDMFQAPDDLVGRRSAPNTLDWSSSELTASVQDHALDTGVPNVDIEAWQRARDAGQGMVSQADPLARATELVMQTVLNRREKRAADLVFNLASYNAANRVTLSGTGQWSDFVNSDPLTAILTAFDSCVMRPNVGTIGRAVATKLQTHPKICKAVFGYNTDAGVAPLDAIRRLLELDELNVGEGWINTAAPGQPASLSRVWGKHAAFTYRDMQATPEGGVTFGFTAQFGDRIAGAYDEPKMGMRGGQMVRAGESVQELVTANDLGYFFQNAVA